MIGVRRIRVGPVGIAAALVVAVPSVVPAAVEAGVPASVEAPAVPSSALLAERLHRVAPTLDREVLDLALAAARSAREAGVTTSSPILTVIDYSVPSAEPRLWVFDTKAIRLLFHERVAHGAGTGFAEAEAFSNTEGSHQSSLGLFLTGDTYVGSNGYSLRMHGLEPGFNDEAFDRAIVVHGAPYVSAEFARRHGRVGRSWGCPAVSEDVARELIDTIRGGSLIFSFFPDRDWLFGSEYLGDESLRALALR